MNEPGVTDPKVELSALECRVVGALIEKQFLTPDVYPMTTKALVSACNQKTNRDPVVDYDARTIDGALLDLRQRNIVRKVHTPGARAIKHRQTLDELLDLDAASSALLSVLLLRGPQTVGELRLRTERHEVCDDIDEVEACLEALAARPRALAERLGRQPGQKESRWRHLLADEGDIDAPPVSRVAAPAVEEHVPERRLRIGADPDLESRVAALEGEVAELRERLGRLAAALGESLD